MRAKTLLMLIAAALGVASPPVRAVTINVNSDITVSDTWTADNVYVLTGVRYVRSGATLTIEPGTVVRGEPSAKQCLVTGVACATDANCSGVTPGDICVDDPGTLVVTRGAKIKAVGTALKPIVFTNLGDDNLFANSEPSGAGLYADRNDARGVEGTWGGVILLGRGYVANATGAGPSAAKEVQVEGLQTRGFCTGLPTQQCSNDAQCGANAPCNFSRGFYGNCAASPLSAATCDDDDSGSLQYVSVRYGGFNLNANNEINGLTLGGVGRQTDVDYVEVFQNQDDGIELFGGAVNLKHAVIAFGGDDSLDYDEGWRGKVQFLLAVHGVPGDEKNDKGGEWDGGNGPDTSLPRSIPTIYNATLIGHGGVGSSVAGADDPLKGYDGKATNTAMIFRDNAGGRLYNSFVANFGGSALLIEGSAGAPTGPGTSGERAITNYVPNTGNCSTAPGTTCSSDAVCAPGVCVFHYLDPDSDFDLELKNNQFWCIGNGSTVPTAPAAALAAGGANVDHFDPGVFTNGALGNAYGDCTTALPIRLLDRGVNPDVTKPDWIDQLDPRPAVGSVLLSAPPLPPADGFFEAAAYKGAFERDKNWAEGWTNLSNLGYFPARPSVNVNADITTSTLWTQDNEYVLTGVRYVRSGATLTIEPGTVVRGEPSAKQCLVTGVACATDANCSGVTPGDICVDDPGTLVVTRGAKIVANGTAECPIVFTNIGDDNVHGSLGKASGLYADPNDARGVEGTWGGVILLGRGYVANATGAGPSAAKEVQVEGLQTRGFCTGLPTQQCSNDAQCGANAPCNFSRGFYGNCAASPLSAAACDDDDSGSLQYVSVRYGGFNLNANNEINGLTLGGVGRQTDVDYVEVFQNQDDGIELFGGAVNLKHAVIAFGGDDSLDYDEGWRGKVQFLLAVHGVPGDEKNDKGGEWDGGNGPDTSLPRSIPTIYNATLIGHGGVGSSVAGADDPLKGYDGKATNTAMIFRDNAGGRLYNSFVANFGGSALLIEGSAGAPTGPGTSGERAITDYVPNTGNCSTAPGTTCSSDAVCAPGVCVFHYLNPDSAFDLELQDNYFWCLGNGSTVPTAPAASLAAGGANVDHFDPGVFTNGALDNAYGDCTTALPIRTLDRGVNPDVTKPNWIDELDPVPTATSVLLTTNRKPPVDGFFESTNGFFSPTANYKGAFRDYNWAGWANASRLGYFNGGRHGCARRHVSEVENLRFSSDKTRMTWNAARPGGPKLYDTLRSASASSFVGATFLETDGSNLVSQDATIPAVGVVQFYLVRAENGCGEGTIGYSFRRLNAPPTTERVGP